MKKEKGLKRIPKWYLYLALAYALLGLLDVLLLSRKFVLLVPVFTIMCIAWVIFNGLMLFFFKRGYEKISFFLPAYYIAFFLLAYLLLALSNTIRFAMQLQVASSLFELIVVGYFLFRKK